MSDFDTINQMGIPMQAYQGQGGVFDPVAFGSPTGMQVAPDPQAAQQMEWFNQMGQAQADTQVQPAQISSRIDPATGQPLVSVKDMPAKDVNEIQQALQFYKQSLGSFDNRIRELQAREAQAKGNPIMNVLMQLAGQMAQAKDMPGWVQGAGRANLALNPTPDALAHERLGLQKEQAGIASLLAQEYDRKRALDIQEEENRAKNALVTSTRASGDAEKARTNQEQLVKGFKDDAVAHRIVGDKQRFFEEAAKVGMTPAQASSAWRDIETSAVKSQEQKIADDERAAKLAGAKAEATLPVQKILIQERGDESRETVRERDRLVRERTEKFIGLRQKVQQENAVFRADIAADMDLRKLDPKEVNALEGVSKTNKYLNAVSPLLDDPETAKYIGPIRLNKINEWGPMTAFRSPEQQAVMTELIHELPRVVKLFEMGVRAYSPSELWLVKRAGGNQDMTIDQLKEVFRIVDRVNSENAAAIMLAKPKADWEARRYAVGERAYGEFQKFANSSLRPVSPDNGLTKQFTEKLMTKPMEPMKAPDGREYLWDRSTRTVLEKVAGGSSPTMGNRSPVPSGGQPSATPAPVGKTVEVTADDMKKLGL